VCLRHCEDDFDCRPGYGCLGAAGLRGCYPRPQPSATECVPSFELYDRWWVRARAGDTVEQLRFAASGDVEYQVANVSGTSTTASQRAFGTFVMQCPQLNLEIGRNSAFAGGSASFYVAEGALYQNGDTTQAWIPCPASTQQRDGRCFP
jgi:hypothetical protein